MATSSAAAGGGLVESGQKYGNSNLLVTQQWLWYGLANLAARLGGGELAGRLAPAQALQTAALILVVPLFCVVALARTLTPESPRSDAHKDLHTILREMSARKIAAAHAGRGLPVLLHLQPGAPRLPRAREAAAPAHDVLHLRRPRRGDDARHLRARRPPLALIVYFSTGVSAVFSLVMAANLAAEVSPGGQEGLCFAAMMSIENLASIASDARGSYMFDAFFHGSSAR